MARLNIAAVFAFVALLALVAPSSTNAARCTTVYKQIANNPSLSTLKAAVDAAGLQPILDNPAYKYTLFAPTNTAFSLAGASTGINFLALNPTQLVALLYYHILPGVAYTKAALAAMNGATLYTFAAPSTLTVLVQNAGLGPVVTLVNERGPSYAPAIESTPGLYDIPACGGSIINAISFPLIPDFLVSLPVASPPPSPSPPAPTNYGPWASVVEALDNIPELSTFKLYLSASSWFAQPPIPWTQTFGTYYLPSNAAITTFVNNPRSVCPGINSTFLAVDTLTKIHFVLGYSLLSANAQNGQVLNSWLGVQLTLTVSGPTYAVSGPGNAKPSNVINANNGAGLGYLNIIDQVLCV